MEIKSLLNPDIQNYINKNSTTDVSSLAFQKNPFPEIPFSIILEQIAAKQKAKSKLPTWYNAENIIFPSKISVEQTSSEKTAKHKASLISGTTLLDASGGFGVDSYFFAKNFKKVTHCEINTELSNIVKHNFEILNALNIECLQGNSTEIINQKNTFFDCIYLDPSRRNEKKGKVFLLADCEPNVPELLDFYFTHTDSLLLKTAPILDIQAGLNELKFVREIHIVALENEVKEILWKLEKNYTNEIKLLAVNIEKDVIFKNEFNLENETSATYSLPKKYLYEPNAALLKSGKFEAISNLLKVNKLHQHSHLYTSTEIIEDFPGRKFLIKHCFPFDKKNAKEFLQNQKMNVSCRNFPLKPEEIKKKFKIIDGGTIYAFFTTNIQNQKIVVFCEKI